MVKGLGGGVSVCVCSVQMQGATTVLPGFACVNVASRLSKYFPLVKEV